jgi:outer membrane murein-binding lipoprotein Lpp
MRFVSLPFAAVLSILFVSGCATSSQQTQLAAKQEHLATQVQKLQTTVENLKKDVDAFQRIKRTSYDLSGSKGPAAERIAKIEMPADRSAENLKHYINEIIVAGQGQNSFSSDDPQAAMLARVGADNLNLLIDAMPVGSSRGGMGNYHLEQAIKLLADDRHKTLILKELPIRQRLVTVVIDKRWEQDARDILISELEGASSDQLPTEWFKAAASLQDPKTYGALTNYFAKSMNASSLYRYISMLPGIQLDGAVAAAWARIKTIDSTYSTASMAAIAISYGHQDAADALINLLKNPPDRMSSSVNPRITLLMHLDTTGSNTELIAWYEENKDKLVFDPASKKFRLKS